MTLSEILEQLKYGELSQIKLGQELDTAAGMREAIAHINLGLIRLFQRFWLASGECEVRIFDNVRDYYLGGSDYSCMEHDLIRIEEIFDTENIKQSLNDEFADYSFYTPQYNIIKVPTEYIQDSILVKYRAKHPKIIYKDNINTDKTIINISPTFLEPLCLFVAHRAYRVLNGDEQKESNNYFRQYDALCKFIEGHSIEIVPERTLLKLDNNGWV